MKGKIISIIRILAVVFSEILIDIDLKDFTINSIEIYKDDTIILHAFDSSIDIEIPFDDLNQIDQSLIYQTLNTLLYN